MMKRVVTNLLESTARAAQHAPEDVAIVGLACTYPRARRLGDYWQNIMRGVDAVHDAPEERWDSPTFFDPDPAAADRVYCRRGAYLGTSFAFNPLAHGTMPRALQGAEPDQFLVLRTAQEALADAGYSAEREVPGERAAFILGRGNYLGAGLTGLIQRSLVTEQTLQIVHTLQPNLSAAQLAELKRELQAGLPGWGADSAPGMIPNITTGRVANRLNLMGPAFTVDAACASSLIAVELALRGLRSGEYDLALAGGVHIFTDLPLLQVFCAMGALSRAGVIRPFDRACDGTIPGEGAGLVVLKRRSDAERDGDRIYALLKAVGTGSDGRALGVTAPRVEGEELAMRRAYGHCGVNPQTIGLVEAHGTGTMAGDPVEIEALQRVFGPRSGPVANCGIGSVKSMIGHAMPAAGVAGIIKMALALYHRVLPPTLHCTDPLEALTRPESRFYVNTAARPWIHGSDAAPRRAGVNAFGFGGVNAHAVLEEYIPAGSAPVAAAGPGHTAQPLGGTLLREWESELCILEGSSRADLLARIGQVRDYVAAARGVTLRDVAYSLNGLLGQGPQRVAVVAESLDDLGDKLTRLAERLADPQCRQIRDAKGLYYLSDAPARGGAVAFLFPGLGAQYVNMLADLAVHFPEVRACFDAADRAITGSDGTPPSAGIFPPPTFTPEQADAAESYLAAIERANPAVLTANGAMFVLLERLGLRADLMTGHSSGEWVVLPAAGMVDVDEFVSGMSRLNGLWRTLGADAAIPPMTMLSVGADRLMVEQIAAELHRPLTVANDNCPHQVLIAVQPDDEAAVLAAFHSRGIFTEKLPLGHGYHTPQFTYVTAALEEYFGSMRLAEPRARLYSCTTGRPYPSATTEIVALLARTFASPLLFRDTIEAMYADGARIFVEVGPRGNLTAFVDDILRGRPHAAIATNLPRRSGLTVLLNALAQLAALHVPLDLAGLYERRAPRKLAFDPRADRLVDPDDAPGTMRVSLSGPRIRLAPRPQAVAPQVQEAKPAAPSKGAARTELQPAVAPPAPPPAATALPAPTPVNGRRSIPRSAPAANAAPFAAGPQPTAASAPAPSTVRSATPQAQRMHEHLRIMEEFVAAQEDVMQAFLRRARGGAGPAPVSNGEPAHAGSNKAPSDHAAGLTLSGRTEHHVPGREVTVRRTIDPAVDLYLADHCFDPHISAFDPHRERLSIVPLTVSLEMMAEVAGLLDPRRKVVAARDVLAGRWIEVEAGKGPVAVLITATRAADTEPVAVSMRVVDPQRPQEAAGAAPVATATMVLADEYPSAPAALPFALREPRRPGHTAEQMYSERRMFHGPRFRGVVGLDEIGTDGLRATLEVLPAAQALRDNPRPRFHFDPFLLDAAGQLVGYWPVEYLAEGFVLFPIRIRELVRYRDNLPVGGRAACELRISEVGERQLRADFDIRAADGGLWMRVTGWEDWRFYWAPDFYDFWRFPERGVVSTRVELTLPADCADVECRRMAPFGEMGKSMWENLWAHLILSRRELATYRSLGDGARRTEWIFGRAAAKDAVRVWVQRRYGRDLYPADVEILSDENGRPLATGPGLEGLPERPFVSLSHKGPLAVAAAHLRPIGIDLETLVARREDFAELAFTPAEQTVLQSVEPAARAEWLTRAWCAKEAASKARGTGLAGGAATVGIAELSNPAGALLVRDTQAGREQTWRVHSFRQGNEVLALAFETGNDHG